MSPWSDVEWTSLDPVTETKLDTMQGNLDYLREVTDWRMLAASSAKGVGEEYAVGGQDPGTSAVRLTAAPLGLVLGPVTLDSPSPGLVLAQHLNLAIPASVARGGLRQDVLQLEWSYDGATGWLSVAPVGYLTWARGAEIEYLDAQCYIEAHAGNRLFGVPDPGYVTVRFEGFRMTGKRTT